MGEKWGPVGNQVRIWYAEKLQPAGILTAVKMLGVEYHVGVSREKADSRR